MLEMALKMHRAESINIKPCFLKKKKVVGGCLVGPQIEDLHKWPLHRLTLNPEEQDALTCSLS